MCVNFSVFGSKRVSPPVDHTIPSGAIRTVCLPHESWYSVTFSVFGSHLPSLFEPCCVSHTVPSGAGMAEWIAAVPRCGTGYSFISPVFGSSRAILLARP